MPERAEQEAKDAHQLICGSEDDGFLRFLAANYMSRGRHQQALQCLQRLTVLAPGGCGAAAVCVYGLAIASWRDMAADAAAALLCCRQPAQYVNVDTCMNGC